MFSQSLTAQLIRMLLALSVTLYVVHNWEPVLNLLAQHAVDMGCHQQSGTEGHEHHSHHH
ncbi:hypothetical protein [Vibrio intestinalis]|uniref:hypothetical protein n=1 Tax=Vibrio intestinalis TaxID=2933291 RepID=UPI0021A747BF|nr:hypothetical protein [Vibrio intestinalis]